MPIDEQKELAQAKTEARLALERAEALRKSVIAILTAGAPFRNVADQINIAFTGAHDVSPLKDDPSDGAFAHVHQLEIDAAQTKYDTAVQWHNNATESAKESARLDLIAAETALAEAQTKALPHEERDRLALEKRLKGSDA